MRDPGSMQLKPEAILVQVFNNPVNDSGYAGDRKAERSGVYSDSQGIHRLFAGHRMTDRKYRRYGMLENQRGALVGHNIDSMAVMGHYLAPDGNAILQIERQPGGFLHCLFDDLILIRSMLSARHSVYTVDSGPGGNQFSGISVFLPQA